MSNDMHPDLKWLAINVSEWIGSFESVGFLDGEPYWGYSVTSDCPYIKPQWLQARRDLGLVMTPEEEAMPAEEHRRTAESFLNDAASIMAERGKQYDQPGGERSMGKAVDALNAITGRDLTEAEGWLLLSLVKRVRQFSGAGYHQDSAEDAVAYAALEAEALEASALRAGELGE